MSYYELAIQILDSITDENGHCDERYLSTRQGECITRYLTEGEPVPTGSWEGEYKGIQFYSTPYSGYIGCYYVRATVNSHFNNQYVLNSVDRWIDALPEPGNGGYAYSDKDKVDADLQLTGITSYYHGSYAYGQSAYGTIYTFVDNTGNYYKWFTDSTLVLKNKNDSLLDVYPRPGDTCHVRATVKSLSEYRGNKETILSRVRVASVDRASVNVALNL